jgi:hypothetical protein
MARFYFRMAFSWDGQWFLKTKDRFGLDVAMEMNEAAVRSIGKIECRMLKQLLGKEQIASCRDLIEAQQTFAGEQIPWRIHELSDDRMVIERPDCMLWREAARAGFQEMGPGNAPGCRGFMRRMDGWSEVASERYGYKWEQTCSADRDEGSCRYVVTRYEKEASSGS